MARTVSAGVFVINYDLAMANYRVQGSVSPRVLAGLARLTLAILYRPVGSSVPLGLVGDGTIKLGHAQTFDLVSDNLFRPLKFIH